MIWYDTLFIVNYSWYYIIWFVIFVLPLVVLPELALFLASLHLPSSWTGSWTMVKRLDWNSSKATKCIIWTWSDLGKSACPYPVLFGMQNDAHAVTCFVSQLIPIYYEKRSEWENMRSRSRSRSVEILAIKLETCARPRFKCFSLGSHSFWTKSLYHVSYDGLRNMMFFQETVILYSLESVLQPLLLSSGR